MLAIFPSPSGIGTIPQWLTALFSAGVLGALLKFGLKWRGQTLDSDEKIRDHYAKEVARLTSKLDEQTRGFREDIRSLEDHYRKQLADSDQRHEECQKDRDELRLELRNMHEEIAGLKAQIRRYSTDRLLVLEDDRLIQQAPKSLASAKRIRRGINRKARQDDQQERQDKRDEGDNL